MQQRSSDQLRPVEITVDYTDAPLASVLIACGQTRVLCTTSVEERVPPFRLASNGGWLTAEYAMLPGATPQRTTRASKRGRPDGRSTEIQRLIGRSLRAGFNLDKIGPRTLYIDCDVIQADGGTRTAAITGGYVSACIAVRRLIGAGVASPEALVEPIAAISVGIVDGQTYLDLDYPLDSRAEVDMNVIMSGVGAFVEVQGTGEKGTFSRPELNALLDLAQKGCSELRALQDDAIERGVRARPVAAGYGQR